MYVCVQLCVFGKRIPIAKIVLVLSHIRNIHACFKKQKHTGNTQKWEKLKTKMIAKKVTKFQ